MKKFLLSILIILLTSAIFYLYWDKRNRWDAQRIYHEYNSAVWLVHVKWGYKIMVNNEDYTKSFLGLQNKEPMNIIAKCEEQDDGNWAFKGGYNEGTATAFFVREDGVLATNKHVLSPWLYDNCPNEMKLMEKILRKFYANMTKQDTLYNDVANNLKVIGYLDSVWIAPNGEFDDVKHRVDCKLFKVDSSMNYFYGVKTNDGDENDDGTIFQTNSETLPPSVEKVIKGFDGGWFEYDVEKPISDGRIGETVYAIGFPFGTNSFASTIDNKYGQISSQIQNGIITQYRGFLNFGHNIPVANGMSGSPIINEKGLLVGIHATGYTGINGVQGINQGVSTLIIFRYLREWDGYKSSLSDNN